MELNNKTLDTFKKRFTTITSETPRQWGELTPAKMIVHLQGITELSLEERPFKDISNIFTRTIYPPLVFYVFPWPKGKIKVPPEWTPEAKEPLEAERVKFFALIERFVERSEKEPKRRATHPLFGSQSLKFWQRIHGVHFNHHLTQFGV